MCHWICQWCLTASTSTRLPPTPASQCQSSAWDDVLQVQQACIAKPTGILRSPTVLTLGEVAAGPVAAALGVTPNSPEATAAMPAFVELAELLTARHIPVLQLLHAAAYTMPATAEWTTERSSSLRERLASMCMQVSRAFGAVREAPAMQQATSRARAGLWAAMALLLVPTSLQAMDALQEGWLLPLQEDILVYNWLQAAAHTLASRQRPGSDVLPACLAPAWQAAIAGHTARYQLQVSAADVAQSVLGSPLAHDPDVLHAQADKALHLHDAPAAFQLTSSVMALDPGHPSALALHIQALACVAAGSDGAAAALAQAELYRAAHDAVQAKSTDPVAWLGVGCFYLIRSQHHAAAQALRHATELAPDLAAAWVALGHARSAMEESDAALATYRTATQLFPGLHSLPLFSAMELTRAHNVPLAEAMLSSTVALCASDPAVYHEAGVLAYGKGEYAAAAARFEFVIRLLEDQPLQLRQAWQVSHIAGGHAHRRLGAALLRAPLSPDDDCWATENIPHASAALSPGPGDVAQRRVQSRGARAFAHFERAIQLYHQALQLKPRCADALGGLALTQHMLGRWADAVRNYHAALGAGGPNAMLERMLASALADAVAEGAVLAGLPSDPEGQGSSWATGPEEEDLDTTPLAPGPSALFAGAQFMSPAARQAAAALQLAPYSPSPGAARPLRGSLHEAMGSGMAMQSLSLPQPGLAPSLQHSGQKRHAGGYLTSSAMATPAAAVRALTDSMRSSGLSIGAGSSSQLMAGTASAVHTPAQAQTEHDDTLQLESALGVTAIAAHDQSAVGAVDTPPAHWPVLDVSSVRGHPTLGHPPRAPGSASSRAAGTPASMRTPRARPVFSAAFTPSPGTLEATVAGSSSLMSNDSGMAMSISSLQ